MEAIPEVVKTFILQEFLPGESSDQLKESTPLITGGILDSIATLKLVAFLEDRFRITLEAHEVDVENMNTIGDIARLVSSKTKKG